MNSNNNKKWNNINFSFSDSEIFLSSQDYPIKTINKGYSQQTTVQGIQMTRFTRNK